MVPLHPLLPVQQSVVNVEFPFTLAAHDVSPWQLRKHVLAAVHVTSSLHEPKPVQSTRQSVPPFAPHVTLWPHASETGHEMLHFLALHVMSSLHAALPSQVMSHREPPQLIG